MTGHLHLHLGPGNRIDHLSFAALAHVSKSHLDEGARVVQYINPTAGLFEGDELELDVRVATGSNLCLSTPSANRIHPATRGGFARCRQRFAVEAGAAFEFIPEVFIPFAGARYQQDTVLSWQPGARVLFFDWWSPGRVAHGEAFAFNRLEMAFDARRGDSLCLRERAALQPDDTSLSAWRGFSPTANVLTVLCAGVDLSPVLDTIEAENAEGVYLGVGPLAPDTWIIRALCADNLTARSLLGRLRSLLHTAGGRAAPRLGREV